MAKGKLPPEVTAIIPPIYACLEDRNGEVHYASTNICVMLKKFLVLAQILHVLMSKCVLRGCKKKFWMILLVFM